MRVGKVVGNLVSTIKEPAHMGKKLLLVSFLDEQGKETEEEYVYADAAGSGIGDLVLVSEDGSAAATEFGLDRDDCTLDGVILGVVDYFRYDKDILPEEAK